VKSELFRARGARVNRPAIEAVSIAFLELKLGNVQIYDAQGVCSNRQSAFMWERGVWPNRHVTFIMAEKA